MTCQTGIEHDIFAFNPVRDARRLSLPEKKTSVLTPGQLLLVQRLIRDWRKDSSRHCPESARPNGQGTEACLFATKGGKPLSVGNHERVLRTFIDDNKAALEAAGIEAEQVSTHIFRRSTATLVEAVAGITLASRLLGHANEQITRASYVVSAALVDPVTADIIDEAFSEFR